jgi:WD40 repeat protein
VRFLAVLPNDDLASASGDMTIKIWDPQSGILKMTLIGHSNYVRSFALLSDDSLASGSKDGTIKIWNTTTGQLNKTIKDQNDIYSLAVMSNGYLAIGGFNQIRIWDTTTGVIKHIILTDGGYIYCLKVLKNGDLASEYTQAGANLIQIRDPLSYALKANYSGHSSDINDLIELPNGDLVSASSDATIKIWDRATGNVKKTLNLHMYSVESLALLKDGLLASGSF